MLNVHRFFSPISTYQNDVLLATREPQRTGPVHYEYCLFFVAFEWRDFDIRALGPEFFVKISTKRFLIFRHLNILGFPHKSIRSLKRHPRSIYIMRIIFTTRLSNSKRIVFIFNLQRLIVLRLKLTPLRKMRRRNSRCAVKHLKIVKVQNIYIINIPIKIVKVLWISTFVKNLLKKMLC